MLVQCWWECKMLPLLWKTVRYFLKKLNIWNVIQQFHIWVHTQKNWNQRLKQVFILKCSNYQYHNSQKVDIVQISTDRWTDKQKAVCICNEILLSFKNEWDSDTTWMNLKDIILRGRSHSQRNIWELGGIKGWRLKGWVSLGVMKCSENDCVAQLCEFNRKAVELYALNGWIVCYVNLISIKLLKQTNRSLGPIWFSLSI